MHAALNLDMTLIWDRDFDLGVILVLHHPSMLSSIRFWSNLIKPENKGPQCLVVANLRAWTIQALPINLANRRQGPLPHLPWGTRLSTLCFMSLNVSLRSLIGLLCVTNGPHTNPLPTVWATIWSSWRGLFGVIVLPASMCYHEDESL